jgi:hypothetical protein
MLGIRRSQKTASFKPSLDALAGWFDEVKASQNGA